MVNVLLTFLSNGAAKVYSINIAKLSQRFSVITTLNEASYISSKIDNLRYKISRKTYEYIKNHRCERGLPIEQCTKLFILKKNSAHPLYELMYSEYKGGYGTDRSELRTERENT
jgi:hypothetical protein